MKGKCEMILILLLFTTSAARSDPDEIPRILSNLSLPFDEEKLILSESSIDDNITISDSIDATPIFELNEDAAWGEWTVDTPCTDTCGACGHILYGRDCLCEGEDGCPCSEREFRVEVCGTKLCSFPRRTCCAGFIKSASFKGLGQFECALNGTNISAQPSSKSKSSRKTHKTKTVLEETTTVSTTTAVTETWSDWTITTPCTATCGGCGQLTYTRKCLCAGGNNCPCSEHESRVEVCGTKLCVFPHRTCCEGFKKTMTFRGFECVAVDESSASSTVEPVSSRAVEQKMTKKVHREEDAVWGEWIVATPCTETCGACGQLTYTRACLCEGEEGCPCSALESREEVCGTKLCVFPHRTCCEGFKKTMTSNGFECVAVRDSNAPSSVQPASSHAVEKKKKKKRAKKIVHRDEDDVWGEWIVVTPCTDTCGACGRIHYKRDCLCEGEEGCPCSEHETRQEVCATTLCTFPRHTCCDGFNKMIASHGVFECGSGEETSDRWLREDTVQPSYMPRNHIIPNELSRETRPIGEKREEIINDDIEEVTQTRVKKEEASAVWGEWINTRPCTSDCGACGRISFTRECLCAGEEGCPCSQRESRVEVCATKMCKWPRHTCCEGFQKTLTAEGFRCVANKESDERICTGTFTPWVQDPAVGHCSSTCGMCGKRRIATRTCGPEKCECFGDLELFEPCGRYPCREGVSCCEGFTKGKVNGIEECIPNVAIPPALTAASRKFLDRKKNEETKELQHRNSQLKQIFPALDAPSDCTWGDWTEVDSVCSSSCGMCGVRVSARRNCHPLGCNCVGPSTRYEDCGEGICGDKERPCCGFYTISYVNGVATCIDPVSAIKEKRRGLKQKRTEHREPREGSRRVEQNTAFSTSTCRGIWSPFTASISSSCDASCGLCGHRSVAERQCIPQGCTCEGSNKLYERCAEKPCWNKPEGCCEGASIALVDGKRICKEINN